MIEHDHAEPPCGQGAVAHASLSSFARRLGGGESGSGSGGHSRVVPVHPAPRARSALAYASPRGRLRMDDNTRVALAHDYLTQRGGAERVVVSLVRAFPGAPLHTSLYDPAGTFPAFAAVDVRTLGIDRVGALRRRHRLALPLLAPSFSRLRIEADVVVCSSSGWAHGARVEGRKIVYCHAPARWLYQPDRYLGQAGTLARIGLRALHGPLERWDRKAALAADRYLANSSWIARSIREVYGIEAEVGAPPADDRRDCIATTAGRDRTGLCPLRLAPAPLQERGGDRRGLRTTRRRAARRRRRGARRGRVGSGRRAGKNVRIAGGIGEDELRWLYQNARCLVAASYEDFGLTPVEAAAFGKPTAALRFGGFLDARSAKGRRASSSTGRKPSAIADGIWCGSSPSNGTRTRFACMPDRSRRNVSSRRLREVVAELEHTAASLLSRASGNLVLPDHPRRSRLGNPGNEYVMVLPASIGIVRRSSLKSCRIDQVVT